MKIIRKYIVLIVLGVFTLILVVINFFDRKGLNETGRFVIAEIKGYNQSARGTTYTYGYNFNGVNYVGATKDIAWHKQIGELIMLRILPSNPSVHQIATLNVPNCLTLNMQPKDGWDKMPTECR